jgi:hypothetical protein
MPAVPTSLPRFGHRRAARRIGLDVISTPQGAIPRRSTAGTSARQLNCIDLPIGAK